MNTARPRFMRFGIGQQILFARRLAFYLQSGIPIAQALRFIAEDTHSPSALHIFRVLIDTVASGLPLSSGLAIFPKQFNSFCVGFVRAGEASGSLAETLERLAIALKKHDVLRKKILSALAYPALIFCGTIGITLFLTLFIFPKIIPILRGFKTKLPFTTRALIGINDLFVHNWLLLILLGLIILIGVVISLRFAKIRRLLERILLHIPLFSLLYKYYVVATFSRVLSLQLKGGIRIISALAVVRTALPGTLYPETVEVLELRISEGQRFSFALRQHKRLFPSTVCQMIAAGEATGTLSINLESLADLYEENLDELARNLTVLIEPVLMICMGFVVGFVALAIITPIYAVTQSISIK